MELEDGYCWFGGWVLLDWRLGTVEFEVGYDSGCISGGATGGR